MKKMKHMFYVLMFASFLLLNNITDINAMDANIPSTGGTEPPSSHKDVIVTDSTEMIIGNEYTDCIIGHSAKIYKFTLNKPGRVKIEISGKCDQDIEGTSVVNGFSLGYSTYEWSYFSGGNTTPVDLSENIFTEQFRDDKSIKTDSEGRFSASYNFWLNKGTNYICFFHRTDNTENKTEYTLKTSFEEMQEISNENKCSGTVASNLKDVYCIKLDGTSDLNINVSGKCVQEKTGTCRIRIIDKEYTVISSRTQDVDISGRVSCRFVGYLSKGNYYLVIDYETQSSNNYMDYTIELSCEKMEDSFPEEIGGSDGTFETANNIEIGNLYHGIITFDDKANIDVYKLELTEEKIIEVNAYILKNCTSFKLYNEEIGLLDRKDIENIDDFSTNDKPIGKYKLDKGIYYLCFGDEDSKNIYYNFQIIESLHNWDDGEITTPATCYQEGVKTYHCLDKGCTETYTEPIPINEDNHDYLPEFIWSENGESCQIKFICKYNESHTALYDATVTSIATKLPCPAHLTPP